MKNIYVLSLCDAWKNWSSKDEILVTTSIRKVRKEIKHHVKNGDFEIGNEQMYKDWLKGNYDECSDSELNDILDYGMLEVWED